MKRRDFLINSMAAFSGSVIFSGCKKEELIQKEGSIVKHKFKDVEIPMLSLGCMRLPMNKDQVDMIELDKMIEYSMNHGLNYFDTGYFYVNSKSENATGEVLKKYPRNSYFLADKLPISKLKTQNDIKEIFNEQLKRCGCDYFDFYMAHSIKNGNYSAYENYEIHKRLLELKKQGKIKYVGFSFHGTTDILKEIVDEGRWDFCQLQINYFDWDIIKAKEQYEIVQKAKIPVIVMEPLRGGELANLPNEALNELKKNYPDTTPAEFGLRWAASLDNVLTVLSGMSNLEQIKQNIAVFENFKPVTEEEKEVASKMAKIIQSQGKINCTACKQCINNCPKGINIPAIIAIYNQYMAFKDESKLAFYYETLSEKERAGNCIKCGLCNKKCPKKLDIPELLAKINDKYKEIKAFDSHKKAKA